MPEDEHKKLSGCDVAKILLESHDPHTSHQHNSP